MKKYQEKSLLHKKSENDKDILDEDNSEEKKINRRSR